MNRVIQTLVGAGAAAAMVIGVTAPATASPEVTPHAASAAASGDVALRYSERDIVAFFLLGTGPVLATHQELARTLGIRQQEVPDATIDALVTRIVAIDPNFQQTVVEPIQSGDPVRAKAALDSLSVTTAKLTASRLGTTSRATPQGAWKLTNWVLTTNAAAAAFVVAVAAAAVVGPVLVVLYRPSESMTRFEGELQALEITEAL